MEPMVVTAFGPKFTAKSSMALTFPKPIAYYDLELGGARAWEWHKLVNDGVVLPRKVIVPGRDLVKRWAKLEGYIEAWKQFVTLLEADLLNDHIATIVFDTGTVVRGLAVDGFLEFSQNAKPDKKTLDQYEYREPNRRTEDVMGAPKRAGKDLVVIYHETDEYSPRLDSKTQLPMRDEQGNVVRIPTGYKVPDGYGRAESDADWVLHSGSRLEEYKINGMKQSKLGPVPYVTIMKSPYGLDFYGDEIKWPSYAKLMNKPKLLGRVT